MFTKTSSYIALGIAFLISIVLVVLRPVPEFDYDFEQFFPQNDPDLDFYESYRSTFENDNDYLLFALGHEKNEWLDSAYLQQSWVVQQEISEIDGVDSVISILNLQQPIIGVFGVRNRKVLEWNSPSALEKSKDKLSEFEGNLIAEDGDSFLIWVKNAQNITKEEGDRVYAKIQQKFAQAELTPRAVAGKIQAQGDFVKLMQSEFGLFLGLSFLLILIVLILVYRSKTGVLVPVFVLAVGVAWAFAWIVLSGRALDVMSIMQPTIFLIVGMSALIHFFTHLAKKLQVEPKNRAIALVFQELFVPVGLTILTTGLGFISLYFTTIPALKSFGLTTGVGIFVIFLAVILITPGLLHFFPVGLKSKRNNTRINLLLPVFQKVLNHKKVLALGFLTLALLGAFLGTRIQINGFLLDSLPQDHPIQEDLNYFDAQYGGSNPLELSIRAVGAGASLLDYEVLKEIHQVELELVRIFGERQFLSPVTLVKTLNQAQNQGDIAAFRFPTPGQHSRMNRWQDQASKPSVGILIDESRAEGRISGRLPDLGSYVMSQKREELRRFVEQNIDAQLLDVRWTGTAFLIDKGHQSVTKQMLRGLGVAFVLVGLIAGILFKSWRIAFILLLPNLFPLLMMLCLMFFLGIQFKLSTAILFSVAFGIAVDDSIHFMTRLKFELGKGKGLLYALKRTFLETGYAIALTTLVLVSGFGLLMFSQFEVTYFTGLLISASLIFALLADLFLLPILLLPMKKIWDKKRRN
ncbi:efflux RND transporter permease subunit [Algoriphagus namhaensis]